MTPLAFLGGTGPEGFGLALRFAAAGEAVLIGSRAADRARETARRIADTVPGARADGCLNEEAIARADRLVLAVPFPALDAFLHDAAAALAGKLVIDVVVPLARRGNVFVLAPVPGAASVGEMIQQAAPTARVVSALKNLAAAKLQDLTTPLEGDVVLCGDDRDARAAVAALIGRLPGVRAVDAGGLANAHAIEAVTALQLNLNRRHHALTSVAFPGIR